MPLKLYIYILIFIIALTAYCLLYYNKNETEFLAPKWKII